MSRGRPLGTGQVFARIVWVGVVGALLVGVVGVAGLSGRQERLGEAIAARGTVSAAMLDVHRALADAEAASLNALLVDEQRAAAAKGRFREDLFDAHDALRRAESAAAGCEALCPADQLRTLTDHLPEYSRLVEAGWVHSSAGNPVATSYLSQASYLMQATLLPDAEKANREQRAALVEDLQAGVEQPWFLYLLLVAVVAGLVWAQRFVRQRTRRTHNRGLLAATGIVVVLGVVVVTATGFAAGQVSTGTALVADVVVPLAEARNDARKADGQEARIVAFPAVGDRKGLADLFESVRARVDQAGAHVRPGQDQESLRAAVDALARWRETAEPVTSPPDPPLDHAEMTAVIVDPPAGRATTDDVDFDAGVTAVIDHHTDLSTDAARAAWAWTAPLPWIVAVGAALAAGAVFWGMRPRLEEYR